MSLAPSARARPTPAPWKWSARSTRTAPSARARRWRAVPLSRRTAAPSANVPRRLPRVTLRRTALSARERLLPAPKWNVQNARARSRHALSTLTAPSAREPSLPARSTQTAPNARERSRLALTWTAPSARAKSRPALSTRTAQSAREPSLPVTRTAPSAKERPRPALLSTAPSARDKRQTTTKRTTHYTLDDTSLLERRFFLRLIRYSGMITTFHFFLNPNPRSPLGERDC
ncbi:hypothetical protein BJ166DRAFT_531371 [Pestalotiopsis sp. NC0098]|nr:hypothetical protein BJ166DRAFT_531371 [Pestalotiopsis sp. NC0098]